MRIMSCIFIFAIVCTSCNTSQDAAKKETPPVPVLAQAPTIKDVPIYIESIGVLQPSVFLEIRPQVSGTVHEVSVKEGQWVKVGDDLITIDPKPYLVKVQEAEAQLTMDQAIAEGAQKKLERFKTLAQRDLIAQTEWDELETQSAKGKAAVEADEARLNAARLDLERCYITSPTEGRIGKIDIHPGYLVSNGQATKLLTISKMDPLIVDFAVTEKELPQFAKNKDDISIETLCASQTCTTGKITFQDNHFDSKTGLLLIRGTIANPELALRPGQNVKVRVPVSVIGNAKLIPQKAVKYNTQGAYVYIVQSDNTVAMRPVILGEEHGKDVIVQEGIDPSEPVITDGHLRLYPGLKVEVKK